MTPHHHEASHKNTFGGWLLIALLWLLAAWHFRYGSLFGDSTRDVMQALSVWHGDLPTQGPQINGIWHLGPLWFYLLAVPLKLTHSLTWTMFFIGMLSAAVIPLSYLFGRQWMGHRRDGHAFGLLMACIMAMPGIYLTPAVIPTHAALSASMTVLCGWLILRAWHKPTRLRLLGVALTLCLALHAHPSTLWLLVPCVVLGARHLRHTSWQHAAITVVCCVCLGLLPLAPMLIEEAQHGFPQWQQSLRYAEKQADGGFFSRAWNDALAWMQWNRHHLPGAYVAPALGRVWFTALQWLSWLTLAFSAGLLLRSERNKHLIPWATAMGTLLFVISLRKPTTVWMLYTVAPVWAWLAAEAWFAWSGRHTRWIQVASALVAIVGLVGSLHFVHQQSQQGVLSMGHVRLGQIDASNESTTPFYWPNVMALDAWSDTRCDHRQPVLVGSQAMYTLLAQDAMRLTHCSTQMPWRLASHGMRTNSLIPVGVAEQLLPPQTYRALNPNTTGWITLPDVQVLYPIEPQTIQPEYAYPPFQLPDGTAKQTQTIALPSGNGLLLVTNRHAFFRPQNQARLYCKHDEIWQIQTFEHASNTLNASVLNSTCSEGRKLELDISHPQDMDVVWWDFE